MSSEDTVRILPGCSVSHPNIEVVAVLRSLQVLDKDKAAIISGKPFAYTGSPQARPQRSLDTSLHHCCPEIKKMWALEGCHFFQTFDPENMTKTSPPVLASSATLAWKASKPSTFTMCTILLMSAKKLTKNHSQFPGLFFNQKDYLRFPATISVWMRLTSMRFQQQLLVQIRYLCQLEDLILHQDGGGNGGRKA